MSPPFTQTSSDDFILQTPEPGSFDASCIDNLAMPTLSHMIHDRALALTARPSGLEHLFQKKRSLPSPMSFTIPTRRAPPPPILVPLAPITTITPRHMQSAPPPPPKSSPQPPSKALPPLPALPKLPPPSRCLPPPPPGPPPKVALPPLPLELPPFSFEPVTMSRPAFSPTISEPHAPSTRSSALGPDSAYARYRARSRAKTLASSLPSACETVEAAHAANGEETLAETIAAIREAEEWDWPIPPFVRRPSRPTMAEPPQPQEKERVEELRQVKSYAPEWESYSMHPFAAARHDAGYAPRRVRRGSTASLAAQHSGSSLGSGSEGPRTPDECPGSPQFTLVRGPSGLVIKSIGPLTERPLRRYGTPF
ncbi:hypothetical protein CspHIS471_0504590 [Cutaneotrichosporon sp. HIS471]|nr:hypothetical protein CspHIS471_0504590 [Cutaneotrichosporon sp. HIS471]